MLKQTDPVKIERLVRDNRSRLTYSVEGLLTMSETLEKVGLSKVAREIKVTAQGIQRETNLLFTELLGKRN